MFIDEWFGALYYKRLPLGYSNEAKFCFGQISGPTLTTLTRTSNSGAPSPSPSEPTKTIASQFRITAAGEDAFKRLPPLHAPKLETNEEFIVVRAKVRPVMLIQAEFPLAPMNNRGFRGRIQRRRTLVAQVFGLADSRTRTPEFNSSFVDRVRRMEFPQLMFLPHQAGVFDVDSMLRLDEAQSVFIPHLRATELCLGDDVANVLPADQFSADDYRTERLHRAPGGFAERAVATLGLSHFPGYAATDRSIGLASHYLLHQQIIPQGRQTGRMANAADHQQGLWSPRGVPTAPKGGLASIWRPN